MAAMAVDHIPIKVQVLGNKGYVWDPEGAKRMRLEHHIIGAMVGGVAQFKNQNSVSGLPLELTANEVTLCLEKGWITLSASPAIKLVDHTRKVASSSSSSSRAQGWALSPVDDDTYDDYYQQAKAGDDDASQQQAQQQQAQKGHVEQQDTAQEAAASGASEQEAAGAAGSKPGKQKQESSSKKAQQQSKQRTRQQQEAQQGEQQQRQQQQAADAPHSVVQQKSATGEGYVTKVALHWRDALSKNMAFQVPVLPSRPATGSAAWRCPTWSYPSTPQEQLSYAIFSDLHSKGFSITGGIKFGAEFLVYPGDPALYHAQFTVRTVAWGAPLDPVLLKSIARGSHAARKHLMLASMRPAADGNGFVPYYISVAPQLGFGHQNQ